MSFFTEYLTDAQSAHSQTGVWVSVILAQWADETGYGGSTAFVKGNNFAGVSIGGGVNTFPTKAAGLAAYIETLNLPYYDAVRSSSGTPDQVAVLLGQSPWSAAHYNATAYDAGLRGAALLANAGIDLVTIIANNNLTQYDSAALTVAQQLTQNLATADAVNPGSANYPVLGMTSQTALSDFIINGAAFDLDVTSATVTAQLDLSITQASTFTLTLTDPDRTIINSPIFNQRSVVSLAGGQGDAAEASYPLSFSLVSVEKEQDVLTATFESFYVAILRTLTGAIVSAPGEQTRTNFAAALVHQVYGLGFSCAPDSYLSSLSLGYAGNTKEQISRGTSDLPLEDSWTCLQRLASEIQWVCFECFGVVYFGPYSWLTAQAPVMAPIEFVGGIDTIDGTYDVGIPLTTMTITCKADSWMADPGDCVQINNLGPYTGLWIVSEIERDDIEEPDITITIMQPLPGLPEPMTGGATAPAGSGTVNPQAPQSTGGSQAAQLALAFAIKQLGKPYIYGGTGPAGYDCSGLVQAAYAAAGIAIPRTTTEQWPTAAGPSVPAGIGNLLPGDLMYFAGSDPPDPGHVAMVVSTDKGTNTVKVINAYMTGQPIEYATITYVNPGGQSALSSGGFFAGTYYGALRPSP